MKKMLIFLAMLVLALTMAPTTVGATTSNIEVISSPLYFGAGGWGGWSCPQNYPLIVSASVTNSDGGAALYPITSLTLWKTGATVSGFTYSATPWGYTYGTGEEGAIVQNNFTTGQTLIIHLICRSEEVLPPVPVLGMNLSFMQPCQPVEGNPASAEWRVRNPNDFAVDFTVNQAGVGQILTGTAQPGDSFFTTSWGSQTLILGWSDNGTPKSKSKAGGDSFNGTMCEVPTPVADLNLTFMQPCQLAEGNPVAAEWRVRNPNDFAVNYTVDQAGVGQILTGTAQPGDNFIETPWGAQTLILKWLDQNGALQSNTKAGGNTYNRTMCTTVCEWNDQLTADDALCVPPPDVCQYDSNLTADDPLCVPPPVKCEWNEQILATDPLCVEPPVMCTITGLENLEADDPLCVEPPPPVMCEWNEQILATDPLCVPPPPPVPLPVCPVCGPRVEEIAKAPDDLVLVNYSQGVCKVCLKNWTIHIPEHWRYCRSIHQWSILVSVTKQTLIDAGIAYREVPFVNRPDYKPMIFIDSIPFVGLDGVTYYILDLNKAVVGHVWAYFDTATGKPYSAVWGWNSLNNSAYVDCSRTVGPWDITSAGIASRQYGNPTSSDWVQFFMDNGYDANKAIQWSLDLWVSSDGTLAVQADFTLKP